MTDIAEGRDLVVGVDPTGTGELALAWAVDEAHRRRVRLRLVTAVPLRHDTQHVDDGPHQDALRQGGKDALHRAAEWAHARHPDVELTLDLLAGAPAPVLCRLSRHARMVVLGSRHLGRVQEAFDDGSAVLPVTARAHCPVVVVGDAEHVTQEPAYLVVGVDGSEPSKAAIDLAFREASLRRCALRAISVWHAPAFSFQEDAAARQVQRRMLSEAVAGWSEQYPDVALTHEVSAGHPVEVLAEAAEHALALVVGRRGNGGYTGMRLGSVVHGLLHRAHCPVITTPTAPR
ncbi:universal stress protein [Streptomyces sp. NPDC006691]|uniref:universal stress protein n=1 Tax=Streptomyces sp. NPDC006691 TaxID=3364757 RepID=UPI00369F5E6D